jgi:hypothetical protein
MAGYPHLFLGYPHLFGDILQETYGDRPKMEQWTPILLEWPSKSVTFSRVSCDFGAVMLSHKRWSWDRNIWYPDN